MTTSNQPAYRSISNSIREDILAGRLVPGDRLPSTAALAERFGVGHSTIREALRELASQGLTETNRGSIGGTFVAIPGTDKLARSLSLGIQMLASGPELSVSNIVEARELIELPAARLASIRADEEHRELIRAHTRSLEAMAESEYSLIEGRNFHRTVIKAAGNPFLELMREPIFHVLQMRYETHGRSAEYRRRINDDHRQLAQVILSRDPDRAVELMRDHLAYQAAFYPDIPLRATDWQP